MSGGFFPRPIVEAARSADAGERARALETLVAAYWRPVYRHVRKWGKEHEEAADLTQDFFAQLLERDLLGRFDPSKAKLRTYLRVCVDGLVANDGEGGGAAEAGRRRGAPLARLRRGARASSSAPRPRGRSRPSASSRRSGRGASSRSASPVSTPSWPGGERASPARLFEIYDLGAEGDPPPSYADLARRFGVSVTDVTNGLSLARREFRRIVLGLLREMTGSEEEYRLEARALLGIDAP